MSDYDVGDGVTLTAEFRDSTGALADPTAVSFRIKARAASLTTYVYLTDAEIVRDSLGTYHVRWPIVAAGIHEYRWISSGNDVDQEEPGEFYVRPTNV